MSSKPTYLHAGRQANYRRKRSEQQSLPGVIRGKAAFSTASSRCGSPGDLFLLPVATAHQAGVLWLSMVVRLGEKEDDPAGNVATSLEGTAASDTALNLLTIAREAASQQ